MVSIECGEVKERRRYKREEIRGHKGDGSLQGGGRDMGRRRLSDAWRQ